MGHNATRNPFRRARLHLDAQAEVDEYKARSVWGRWWSLDPRVRRRYFTREERAFVTRYGARLDAIATHRVEPRTDRERHFLKVCIGEEEPESPRERLWLLVQLVCRFEHVVNRAAKADLAEHDAFALRYENDAMKAKLDRMERHAYGLQRQVQRLEDDLERSVCNVVWMTGRFRVPEVCGPMLTWRVMTPERRGPPIGVLTPTGLNPC